ncbi:MAG: type II CRISPR RNA-guided endonuclease Cas9 [Chitinophagaceae bacterium]
MEKIIGIDLGTNSIGWAIRDTAETENQIIDRGVLTFDKGVGEGKSGEFPLVQKRTESRSKRRNYQAEKYRKWSLLETLIEQKMCPLSIEELDEWRKYTKGAGRKYPQSEAFIQWLRFDFDGDGKPDFEVFGFSKHESYYLFRMLVISEEDEHKKIFNNNPHILGRVLYQLVQRRGYRGRDDEDEEAKSIMKGSDKTGTTGVEAIIPLINEYKTLGAALYHLSKDKNERIRKRYNLRTDYEAELKEICRVQNVEDGLYQSFWKAIIWQRPLRSQKGSVGYCTLETPAKNAGNKFIKAGKKRSPVSHPSYEEFRTWVFLNNLKIKLPNNIDKATFLKENIYPLFYKVSKDFKLCSINKELRKAGGYILSKHNKGEGKNKDDDTKVISCTLLNSLKEILGNNWKDEYGWHEAFYNQPKNCPYSFEDIWHVLFTFDSKEKLKKFASEKLGLNEELSEKFSKIKLQQGYATLSLSAIKKILPYLYEGFIYSEAVYLANLPKVLGAKEVTPEIIKTFSSEIEKIISKQKEDKELINVINSLISDQLNSEQRFGMDTSYQLDKDDINDITLKLQSVFGEKTWNEKAEADKQIIFDIVSNGYLNFLRKPINSKKENLFEKPERLHDKIFDYLKDTYDVPDENKKYLWHPSEQETYEEAPIVNGIQQLGKPQPISNGFKNPMALKTLHKLKGLMNYLLQKGKIDDDTRVVIEIARELNDANKRKAIERYQRIRENENDGYKKLIQEMNEELDCKYQLDINNKEIIDKYRLWEEQEKICLYTGRQINFCDLFNGNKYDFEHTVPASMSFDNELKNLTISDGHYNKQIKHKQIPTQLSNYYDDVSIGGITYTAIQPRLKFMEEKVEKLEADYEYWKYRSKVASTKEKKDDCIQRKHLIRFDLDYWRKKLDTFTITEYKAGWRNSQLRDTQIVTKFALPFLKTVFKKVDVQKGSVTAAFREIYKIQPRLEKKDRTKHTHHAIDAAVLTLIPPAAIRDKILFRYNEEKDNNPHNTYHETPRQWTNFSRQHIMCLEDDTLINFQAQHRTLTDTYKNVRKRGKQQFVKEKLKEGSWNYKLNENGNKIPLVAQGDTIRGQLHKESFFGAIKKNGNLTLVERYPISTFTSINDCKNIVDDSVRKIVKETIEIRMSKGVSFDKAKLDPIPFPNGKAVIKKVRCKVAAGRGYLTPEKALEIQKHTFLSKHDYKHYTYAQNEENTLCLYYELQTENEINRAFRIIGLFEVTQLKLNNFNEIKNDKAYNSLEMGKGKNKKNIPLSTILKSGTKVIFYKEHLEELKDLHKNEVLKRFFRIYKFNEMGTPNLFLQNHLEARKNELLDDGDTIFDANKLQYRLKIKADKFTCAIEGKHFEIKVDGEINWLM